MHVILANAQLACLYALNGDENELVELILTWDLKINANGIELIR